MGVVFSFFFLDRIFQRRRGRDREESKRMRERAKQMDSLICVLPKECLSLIISFTSPADASRSAAVSRAFRSAADSDAVWGTFLPADYREIIASAAASFLLTSSMSKKDLYFHICHNPIFLDKGTMSFVLEKQSGKKCYMIGARGLSIIWGETPPYWRWKPLPESSFTEVAELSFVCWFDVKGRIETENLSLKTTYAAYLVFKFAEFKGGFDERPVELSIIFERTGACEKRMAFLDPSEDMPKLSRNRGDGWMEIEIGSFFNENGDDGAVVSSLMEVDDNTTKRGLIVEGIEFRPKHGI